MFRPSSWLTLVVVLVLVLTAGRCPAEPRTWTDRTGELHTEAELVDFNSGRVWLKPSEGPPYPVPVEKLSEADRQWVQDWVRRRDAGVVTSEPTPESIRYARPRKLGELSSPRVDESSGLAASRRQPGLFWTHNDSGDDARIYLFDRAGHDLGSCRLAGTEAFDWEDILSFQHGGKPYLIVCDVGNNGLAATVQMLHVIEEPPIDPQRGVTVDEVPVLQTINYYYEDDHRNCEAVAIDPTDRTLFFVTKHRESRCYVYTLPWPKAAADTAFKARLLATLHVPTVTAMDISPDGRRAMVLTYGNAYEFARRDGETWATALARPPRLVVMPRRIQGESICYGTDGKTLHLTSEKLPTPLWEVPVEGGGDE